MRSNEESSEILSAFIDEVCQTSHLRVEADLGDGFVRLRSDEAERRQAAQDIRSSEDIVIEMLRNSRDAECRTIYLATTKAASKRTIVVIDDGVGIPETHQELIFEPRVTSKLDTIHMDKWGVHGRGMALYSISVNSERASVASSAPGLGAAIAVQTDTDVLKEKVDQSTFPLVVLAEKGRAHIKGPHNINRTAVEFALEHRRTTEVFLGSPAEIAATMYANSLASHPRARYEERPNLEEVPLIERLRFARNDHEFAALCADLGLEMSSRTARRIMDGQICPLLSLTDLVERMVLAQAGANQTGANNADEQAKDKSHTSSLKHSARSPKICQSDMASVERAVRDSFSGLAEAYYLVPDVPIETKVVNGSLRISIPLVNLDE